MVFVLQMLPVKQAVRSFCFGNSITEEMIDINEFAGKTIDLADGNHHFFNHHLYLLHASLSGYNTAFGLYIAMLPSSRADDIETPPPNVIIG